MTTLAFVVTLLAYRVLVVQAATEPAASDAETTEVSGEGLGVLHVNCMGFCGCGDVEMNHVCFHEHGFGICW
jgi:hypothetical protein